MDKISRAIERRAAEIVSIPIENVEPLQVVRYTEGQEFTLHHDAGTLINETLKKTSSSSLWSVDSNHSHNSNHSNYSNASNHSNMSNMSYSVKSSNSQNSNSYGGHSMDYIYNTQFLNNCNCNNNMNTNHTHSNHGHGHGHMNMRSINNPYHQNSFNNNCMMMNGHQNMNNLNINNHNNLNVNINAQMAGNINTNNNNQNNQNNINYINNPNNNINRISVHSNNINNINIPFPSQIQQIRQLQQQQIQIQQHQHQHQSQSSPAPSLSPITPSSPIPPANQMSSAQYAQYYQKFQQMVHQQKHEVLRAQQGTAMAQRMYNTVNALQMNTNNNNINPNGNIGWNMYQNNNQQQRGQSVNVRNMNTNNHQNKDRYYHHSQSCPPISQLEVFKMTPKTAKTQTPNQQIADNYDDAPIQTNDDSVRDCVDKYDNKEEEVSVVVCMDIHMKQDNDDNEDDDDDDDKDEEEEEEDDENLTKQEFAERYSEYSVQMVKPIRLCSYFVYLTTLPEGCGGETYFPKLGLKVRPERGKAILWCNVDPENTMKADPMVIHRAMPVIGDYEKIGMNIWINGRKVDSNFH